MGDNKSSLYQHITHIGSFKWEMALKSILAGALGGLLAIIYRLATEKGVDYAIKIYDYIKVNPAIAIVWVLAAIASGLFIAWLIKLEPMASGGGVPQVEGLILYGLKMKWYLVIVVRYLTGILGSVFGMSFGPEGPSVQLGAAVNEGLSKKICKTKIGADHLITAGAAAGLSAAFSAPLTGMLFALEEIHRSFSPSILLAATTASITADFISKHFFGLQPIFYFRNVSPLPLNMYLWLFPLAIFVGIFGILTNRGFLFAQTIYSKIPAKFRPMIAILLCLPCAMLLPEVLGGGRNLINMIEDPNYTLKLALLILIVKILFSCSCFGSSTPGGIFMPIISIAALSGTAFALIAVRFGVQTEYLPIFVICAMAIGLSSCVKAPVTSILLTIELTGSFDHILPVTICAFTALLLSDISKTKPIYEVLLKRHMNKNGYSINLSNENRSELIEIPVECGCKASDKALKDIIDWPKEALIVGLRRGTEEIIPKGDTIIMAGDYLLIIAPNNMKYTIKQNIQNLCRKN